MSKELDLSLTPDEAHDIELEIKVELKKITLHAFQLGYLCRKIKDGKGWTLLGHATLDEWIGHLGIKRRTFYNFLKLNELWEKKLKYVIADNKGILLNTPYSKLLMLSKQILDEDDNDKVAELVHKAYTLSRSDLKKEMDTGRPFILRGRCIPETYIGKEIKIGNVKHNHPQASNQAIFGVIGNKLCVFTIRVLSEDEI